MVHQDNVGYLVDMNIITASVNWRERGREGLREALTYVYMKLYYKSMTIPWWTYEDMKIVIECVFKSCHYTLTSVGGEDKFVLSRLCTTICIVLTLNAPVATKVVCFSRLLKCLRSLYGKKCGPRSDCSYRSSLMWVHPVCFYT